MSFAHNEFLSQLCSWHMKCSSETLSKLFPKKSEQTWLIFRKWINFYTLFQKNRFFSQSSSGHVKWTLDNPEEKLRQNSEDVWVTVWYWWKKTRLFQRKKFWVEISPEHEERKYEHSIDQITPKVGETFAQSSKSIKNHFFLQRIFSQKFLWTRKRQFRLSCGKFLPYVPKHFVQV